MSLCLFKFITDYIFADQYIETIKYFLLYIDSGYKGLWHEPSHLAERSFCLNHLADIYNCSSLPLFYSDLAMVPMQTAMAKCARLS